ncbi:Wadjet anti-phage system protein JetD domain-containing protein [Texcoconibacillus texcoconensis]|uniref:Wadjet protein JetD C-terminal domain-containing protein n=1 Tax=Texcoconibacillus texcoconensis TaxID=1095777 RepID=A0A840QLY7_9BACI|nr:Wadjet anti-phage system protein JetD domain-containing protein [Texcoconibacillus texcoconensis]MBB5172366.1 hypothetical protein [Texcoconibacillus texcoconensis]
MKEQLIEQLKNRRKKKLTLNELEQMMPSHMTYEAFAELVVSLQQEEKLIPVKASGENGRKPSLPYAFKINHTALNQSFREQLEDALISFHPNIPIDKYFRLGEKAWNQDFPYLQQIDRYLKTNGLPERDASLPQRSYDITGDEKWLERGGIRLLQKLNLLDVMKLEANPDPLMVSVDIKKGDRGEHVHLIVENKTTYHHLKRALPDTPFTSLVYGAGWRVVANIDALPSQLHAEEAMHIYYYFGDLDEEGIHIWSAVNERCGAIPAVPFYEALLSTPPYSGKNQQRNESETIVRFSASFSELSQEKLRLILNNDQYIPQEALQESTLQQIWRDAEWMSS